MSSSHPEDGAHGYCGACHAFTADALSGGPAGAVPLDGLYRAAASALVRHRFPKASAAYIEHEALSLSLAPWLHVVVDAACAATRARVAADLRSDAVCRMVFTAAMTDWQAAIDEEPALDDPGGLVAKRLIRHGAIDVALGCAARVAEGSP